MTDTPNSTQGRLLIIAGSDSSGGAGLQADIKTAAAFGAYTSTAVTAVTVQTTDGVQRVELLAPDLVAEQARAALTDIGADVVKIGMLGSAAVASAVADVLEEHAQDALIVLDPVMVSSSGDTLLDDEAQGLMRDRLLPLADLVTPNAPEATVLTGLEVGDAETLRAAGAKLLGMGAGAALMKGGHISGNMVVDVLVTDDGVATMTSPRLRSRSTHGTGCTLASAVASNLALGADIGEAVSTAREYVFEAIRTAPGFGSGKHGPLNHGLAMAEGDADEEAANPFAALKALKNE